MSGAALKLLLDAHVSGPILAEGLRREGCDVRAVDEERALDGASDADLLASSAQEGRIIVTFNAKHLVPLTKEWAEAGREHAGCIIVVGVAQNEFGTILAIVVACLEQLSTSESWRDLTVLLGRSSGRTPASTP